MPFGPSLDQIYTFGDYRDWPDDERWELIDGEPYAMTAPKRINQEIVTELAAQLYYHFKGTDCSPYVAPFDVRLPEADEQDADIKTTVQPDLSVIRDQGKLDDLGCRGAPDWVIEVLSTSTSLRDMNTKRDLCERHGVREYWLVHQTERWIMIYVLNGNKRYGKGQLFGMDQETTSIIFSDLNIDWLFMPMEDV